MSEIRNLLFDLGNVIIDIDIKGAKFNIEALLDPKYPGKEVESYLYQAIHQFEVGEIDREVFLQAMLKYALPEVSSSDMIEAWNSMLIGIPIYRLTMLEKLRQDFNVLLLSNTNAIHLEWVYDHMNRHFGEPEFEQKYFDDTYYSHLIKSRKPDAKCFQIVLDQSYITPEKTLFIDDFEENIIAAHKLGFKTHLNPAGEEIAEVLKVKGFY
jgi:putative hydrolase of the HAD superfamily